MKEIKRQCRNCKFFRYGEQVVTDTYSGITNIYDGYCNNNYHWGQPLVLVDTNTTCKDFVTRGN